MNGKSNNWPLRIAITTAIAIIAWIVADWARPDNVTWMGVTVFIIACTVLFLSTWKFAEDDEREHKHNDPD